MKISKYYFENKRIRDMEIFAFYYYIAFDKPVTIDRVISDGQSAVQCVINNFVLSSVFATVLGPARHGRFDAELKTLNLCLAVSYMTKSSCSCIELS